MKRFLLPEQRWLSAQSTEYPRPHRCNGISPSLQPQISIRQNRPAISLIHAM
jgi:hypothetical protein